MTDKTSEQKALDTLNALIAGGHFPGGLITPGSPPTVNTALLGQIQEQLVKHYSKDLPAQVGVLSPGTKR